MHTLIDRECFCFNFIIFKVLAKKSILLRGGNILSAKISNTSLSRLHSAMSAAFLHVFATLTYRR